MRRTLRWVDEPPRRLDAACALGDMLAVATADQLHVCRMEGELVRVEQSVRLPFSVEQLHDYGDQNWIVATGGAEGAVVWTGKQLRLGAKLRTADGANLVATLCLAGTEQGVLVARTYGQLDRLDLDGRELASLGTETFRFSRLVPLGAGTRVVAVGRFRGESNDSLSVLETTLSFEQSEAHFTRKRGVIDYAAALCVGPCGDEAFVAFRVPADHELDEDNGDDGYLSITAPIYGSRCAYVRRLDGEIVQHVEVELELESFAPAAGGARTLAVAGKGVIHLIDRETEAVTSVAARWLGASAEGGRVIVEQDGEIGVWEL